MEIIFKKKKFSCRVLREAVKYYFADFVRKGGGVPPKSVTYFFDQNQVFFEQKTQFLALFEETFLGKCLSRGRGGTTVALPPNP